MSRKTTIAILFLCTMSSIFAQSRKEIPLYDGAIPNALKSPNQETQTNNGVLLVSKVSEPTLTVYLPEAAKATGAAVVICPGGGYSVLAIAHEGYNPAEKFVEQGIAAIVLKYRLPDASISSQPQLAPLQDAQQAILQVRRHASEWNIKANKVGIMGFSAGGHLASTAGTHFSKAYVKTEPNESVRPDFMMLIYPVISLNKSITHNGSRVNLIGKNPTADQVELFSNEKQVTGNTPPSFLVHAANDTGVPVQNSIRFFEALNAKKVNVELHVFPKGGHGFGLNNPTTNTSWFDLGVNWINKL